MDVNSHIWHQHTLLSTPLHMDLSLKSALMGMSKEEDTN